VLNFSHLAAMDLSALKNALEAHCTQYIDERLNGIQKAMAEAQSSANNETKSSAGDKHETGRAMAQLETEKQSRQLSEVHKLKQAFMQIKSQSIISKVAAGAVVQTNKAVFYLAIGIGKVQLDDYLVFIISPTAPIAQTIMGLQVGDQFQFNGTTQTVIALT